MRTRNNYWLLIVLLFNMLVALVVFGEWFAPVRSYIVFLYLLLCPGLSLATLIPSNDKLTQFFLITVISISIDTTTAEALLYIGKWNPELNLILLMIISLVGVVSELYTKIRRTTYSIS